MVMGLASAVLRSVDDARELRKLGGWLCAIRSTAAGRTGPRLETCNSDKEDEALWLAFRIFPESRLPSVVEGRRRLD